MNAGAGNGNGSEPLVDPFEGGPEDVVDEGGEVDVGAAEEQEGEALPEGEGGGEEPLGEE